MRALLNSLMFVLGIVLGGCAAVEYDRVTAHAKQVETERQDRQGKQDYFMSHGNRDARGWR